MKATINEICAARPKWNARTAMGHDVGLKTGFGGNIRTLAHPFLLLALLWLLTGCALNTDFDKYTFGPPDSDSNIASSTDDNQVVGSDSDSVVDTGLNGDSNGYTGSETDVLPTDTSQNSQTVDTSTETATSEQSHTDSDTCALESDCCSNTDCSNGETCSESGICVDALSPSVVSISPPDGAPGVDANSEIVITFSEPMDTSSIEGMISVSGISIQNLSFSWNITGTILTIASSNGWEYASGVTPESTQARIYTIFVESNVADVVGNPMGVRLQAEFSTLRRITQTFAPVVNSNYFSYAVSTYETINYCDGKDDIIKIGESAYMGGGGDWRSAVIFNTALPKSIANINNAYLSINQATPEDDFYASGKVAIEQLLYQNIDSTILTAVTKRELGILSTLLEPVSTIDITEAFATDIAAGEVDFLFRLYNLDSETNTYAKFFCDTYTLTVEYLLP
ncbi:MAG: Ig-like domain-containing protein [Deltaproteobacteria bacterium]|nr:Ig-like domain-containing protein [Deltaproteobacteria bacterium]